MSTSILTSKGQATIPKDIRKRLNLLPGDCLGFVIDEGGRVLVQPVSIDASESAGCSSSRLGRSVSRTWTERFANEGAGDDRS
jgi:AbrB family looped-hinge helix DNA binding protein